MYDLAASYADGRTPAIEVVSATDGEANALWKLVNEGGRLTVPDISGGWMLQLRLDTRAKRLLAELPEFLRVLEAQEQVEFDEDDFPLRADVNARYARSLGIRRMRQSDTDFPGSVYFTIDLGLDRTGGAVADHSDALPAWLASWLAAPGQADVLSKLARSGCDERHAFALVPPFPTAPFGVIDLLMRDGAPLPSERPELPEPVTHVWAVSGWRQGRGFRWSPGDGWATFDKLQPE